VLDLPRADPRPVLTAADTTTRVHPGPTKTQSPALSPDHPRLDRTGAQRSLTTRAKLRLPGRAPGWATDRGAGSIHHLPQVRQAGQVEPMALVPGGTLLADAGYPGLSAQTAGAVLAPPRPDGEISCRSRPPSPPTRLNARLTRPSGSASSTASAI
jgi:hypothetical protein